jgi:intraflagellar transport protein 80
VQVNKFVDLPSAINDFDAMPAAKGAPDGFALAHADGSISFLLKTGKFDKKHPGAHKGSVIAVKWSYDGSSMASCGEDGVIKIWSRNGSFRNELVKQDSAIYALAWSPESDALLYCSEKTITIKPIQPSKKPTTWKAHDCLVLSLDWNPSSNLIVSAG